LNRCRNYVPAVALAFVTTILLIVVDAKADPSGGTSGSSNDGGFGVAVTNGDKSAHSGTTVDNDEQSIVAVQTIDCGSSSKVASRQVAIGASQCADVWLQCDAEAPGLPPAAQATDILVLTTYANGVAARDVECHVLKANRPRPQVRGEMARQAAEKLLPHPVIGTAPTGHATLVNIETVLWVDTSADRTLGTVTLLGRRVALRAHLQRVDWTFGDHASDATEGPGRAYSAHDPCRTAQCPNYFGHTYRHTGSVTISAQLTWTGQFQVDGGAWQNIPGTVTAAATSDTIRVRQARGVLVPNP
jgi:hypothetical protein